MKVKITAGAARGTVAAPPSKSVTHRALIAGALSKRSVIRGFIPSGDAEATLSCLETLGATVEREGDVVAVGSLDPRKIPECTVDCGESGSTLRFLIPLCLLSGNRVTLRGTEKLISRPLDVYEELCRERGFTFEKGPDSVTVAGRLAPGEYSVPMTKSSQFATGLLFALSSAGGGEILIGEEAESTPYVDMTAHVMRRFGVGVQKTARGYEVGGADYRSLDYTVEGDWSNAAFLSALTCVGGTVEVTGLDRESAQGDRVYPALFKDVMNGNAVDVRDCPDLAPVLMSLASFAGGGVITGTGRLRFKESDRAAAMKVELAKFGIACGIGDDSVSISGRLRAPEALLSSHNDHRIAMALSVLCTLTGGEIDGAEAVAKSYPHYWRDLEKLGIGVAYYDAR